MWLNWSDKVMKLSRKRLEDLWKTVSYWIQLQRQQEESIIIVEAMEEFWPTRRIISGPQVTIYTCGLAENYCSAYIVATNIKELVDVPCICGQRGDSYTNPFDNSSSRYAVGRYIVQKVFNDTKPAESLPTTVRHDCRGRVEGQCIRPN